MINLPQIEGEIQKKGDGYVLADWSADKRPVSYRSALSRLRLCEAHQ